MRKIFFYLAMFALIFQNKSFAITQVPAANVTVTTNTFQNCLTSASTNVQAALNSIDTCLGNSGNINFIESLVESGRNVSLVNDVTSPGNTYCYSTNGSGTKGWYPCAGGGGTPAGNTGDVQINSSGSFGALDSLLQGLTTTTQSPQGASSGNPVVTLPILIGQSAASPTAAIHATIKVNGNLWFGTENGSISYITGADTASPVVHTPFNTSGYAFYSTTLIGGSGSSGGVLGTGNGNSGYNYIAPNGYLYFVSGGGGAHNSNIVQCSLSALTCANMTLSGSYGSAWNEPGIDTDGTYLYVWVQFSPANLIKFSISGSTATVVTSQTYNTVGSGLAHMIKYYPPNGYLYATTTSGSLIKILASNFGSSTVYNLGGNPSNGACFLNGNLWIGNEVGEPWEFNLTTNTITNLTAGIPGFGMYTDGTNIYQGSDAEYFSVYLNGSATPYIYNTALTGGDPNELWITNAGQFVAPIWQTTMIDWFQLGGITELGVGTQKPSVTNTVAGNEQVWGNLQIVGQSTATANTQGFLGISPTGNVIDLNPGASYNTSTSTFSFTASNFTTPGVSDYVGPSNGDLKLGDYQNLLTGNYLDISPGTGALTYYTGPAAPAFSINSSGAAKINALGGSTQCLESVAGVITGTGSACGSGSAGVNVNTYITGLLVTQNSTTSIAVSAGTAYIPSASGLVTLASTTTLSPSLSASSYYSVYLYSNSGTATVEAFQEDPPSTAYQGTARARATGHQGRFIGWFMTDSSSHVLATQTLENAANSVQVSYPFIQILNGGTSTSSFASVSLTGYVPRYVSTNATLLAQPTYVTTAGVDLGLFFSTDGVNAGNAIEAYIAAVNAAPIQITTVPITASGPNVYYELVTKTGGVGPSLNLYVTGYQMAR